MSFTAAFFIFSIAATPPEPERHLVSAKTFAAIAGEYSGEQAFETTRRIVDQHRIQGSPMMARSAELVLGELKAAGIEAQIETFRSDGATKYGAFVSPLGWEIKSGELWITGAGDGKSPFEPIRVSRYADVPMSVSTYSKGGEWSGELIDVGPGTEDEHYQGKDVAGKVVLASGYAANVQRQAVLKRRAAGVVIYPRAGDRPDHPDMIRYNGMWTRAGEVSRASGGFQISANQYTKIRDLMAKGPVTVRGAIDAVLGPGKLTLVHAYLRGSSHPEEEVIVIGHLDHPKWSANDNASGSGALVEMARTLSALLKKKTIAQNTRTIHFIWVPEFFGTAAWIANHPEVRRCGGGWDDPRPQPKTALKKSVCVAGALNLDMVGEDTIKTNSVFYFTRAPDSVPSWLDALLADVLAQTRAAELYAPTGSRHLWPTEITPYAQGSDHDLLLGLGIPATMIGHWPDWTHHSSEDRIDKVDPSELLRAGVFAAAAAHWVASATPAEHARLEEYRRVDRIAQLAAKIPGSSPARTTHLQAELKNSIDKTAAAPATTPGKGARRLVFLPFDDALEDLDPAAQKFWDEAEEKFSAKNIELAMVIFELVNFLDGKTSDAQLAEKLFYEFDVEVGEVWVKEMLDILAAGKLVSR